MGNQHYIAILSVTGVAVPQLCYCLLILGDVRASDEKLFNGSL